VYWRQEGNINSLRAVIIQQTTTFIPTMIQVTDKAKERIAALRVEEGRTEEHNIRVSVKGGGCSGLMYDLGFDNEINPADQVFEDKGVKILVDKKSLLYLLGTVLDFTDGLNGKGFQFINPNASRTCGCGESFSV
jgi:iron-sulfur cluster assembly protein